MNELNAEGIEAACAAYEDHDNAGWTPWAELIESQRVECRADMRAAIAAYIATICEPLSQDDAHRRRQILERLVGFWPADIIYSDFIYLFGAVATAEAKSEVLRYELAELRAAS